MTPKHVEYLLVSQMPFLLSYNLYASNYALKNFVLKHDPKPSCEDFSVHLGNETGF